MYFSILKNLKQYGRNIYTSSKVNASVQMSESSRSPPSTKDPGDEGSVVVSIQKTYQKSLAASSDRSHPHDGSQMPNAFW